MILVKAISQLIPTGDMWLIEPKACNKCIELIKEILIGLDVNNKPFLQESSSSLSFALVK